MESNYRGESPIINALAQLRIVPSVPKDPEPIDYDCVPGVLCNPVDFFDVINRCETCGKLL